MSKLHFGSVNEALQHLADVTGSTVKIATSSDSQGVTQ